MLKKNDYILLIALLTLVTFLSLFFLRAYDDNRLTSWEWVFSNGKAPFVFLILVCGILLAIPVIRIHLPERYALLGLVLIPFGVSVFFWRIPEVIIDSSRYFIQAKYLEVYGIRYFFSEWGREILAWTDLPLVPFLYGLIFTLSGECRIAIQLFNSLFFSLTAVLTCLIGKELWDRETGISAGLLLMGIPYLFTQVPLMLVDTPTMFFTTAALYTFLRALKDGTAVSMACAVLTITLSIFSKYSSWPMLSLLLLAVAVFSLSEKSAAPVHIKRGLFVFLFVSILSALIVMNFLDAMIRQIGLLLSFQKPGLRRWEESFVSTFFFQIHPFISLSALYSLWVAVKKRDVKYIIISCLVCLVFVYQIKRIRYIIPLFPMIALMASYGLQKIADRDMRRFIISCAVISSLAVSLFSYLPFLQRNGIVNVRDAGIFLNALRAEQVDAYVLHLPDDPVNQSVSVPILDLYTHANIVVRDDAGPMMPEGIESSSLRFSWEYRNPSYYSTDDSGKRSDVIVIISNRPHVPIPDDLREKLQGYELQKVFDAYEGIFQYRPVVSIYKRLM